MTIMSGTEFGYTLGTPIGLFVPNEDQRPGDYKEMNKIPRPGHADLTYQLKYGTRASSGGGRSSARETIGRVAAGAIAEKWLNETYGTEISCWVSSIGDVVMPEHAVPLSAGHRGWTREEVDTLGQLRLLRNPRYWRELGASDHPEPEARKKAQIALEGSAEDTFLRELHPATPAEERALAEAPVYVDHANKTYNYDGVEVRRPRRGPRHQTPFCPRRPPPALLVEGVAAVPCASRARAVPCASRAHALRISCSTRRRLTSHAPSYAHVLCR